MTSRTALRVAWATYAALVVAIILALAGCAATPLLSTEEEAMLRRVCGSEEGCAIVPGALWREIERLLKQSGAWKEI